MNYDDNDYIIHNYDILMVSYSETPKMKAVLCPNEHTAKYLPWQRAYRTILSHGWVGLFLMVCLDRRQSPGRKPQTPRVWIAASPEHRTAAAVRSWNTKGDDFHEQVKMFRIPSLSGHLQSMHHSPLFPVRPFRLDPKLHAEVMSVLKLYILQRVLFIISWLFVIAVIKVT